MRDIGTKENLLHELKFIRMFSNKMDPNNAFLDIQSGSGGTGGSEDWAEMIAERYLKNGEKQKISIQKLLKFLLERSLELRVQLLNLKSYAYGWLRTETGVHRLVRKSPFDSGSRRHTSLLQCLFLLKLMRK